MQCFHTLTPFSQLISSVYLIKIMMHTWSFSPQTAKPRCTNLIVSFKCLRKFLTVLEGYLQTTQCLYTLSFIISKEGGITHSKDASLRFLGRTSGLFVCLLLFVLTRQSCQVSKSCVFFPLCPFDCVTAPKQRQAVRSSSESLVGRGPITPPVTQARSSLLPSRACRESIHGVAKEINRTNVPKWASFSESRCARLPRQLPALKSRQELSAQSTLSSGLSITRGNFFFLSHSVNKIQIQNDIVTNKQIYFTL